MSGAEEGLIDRPIIPNDVIADWMMHVASGSWTWVRNTRCKYVTLGIDTRRGAYLANDRDGKPLTADELLWQYGAATLPAEKEKP